MTICKRCFKETTATIMSMFNTDRICMECKAKEKAHPDYQKAVDAECAQVTAGQRNYPGVGRPTDL